MKIDFLNIDLDDQAPIETVNFRDKRFVHRALETGIHRSAVPNGSMKYVVNYSHGVITESLRFFRKANQMAQEAAVMAGGLCVAVIVTLILWGK